LRRLCAAEQAHHKSSSSTDDQDDDWWRRTKYLYSGRVFTFDELHDEVEAEAASLDPEQWIDGEFVFDAWLSDSLLVGTVEGIDDKS
jgi:hypothetical protein